MTSIINLAGFAVSAVAMLAAVAAGAQNANPADEAPPPAANTFLVLDNTVIHQSVNPIALAANTLKAVDRRLPFNCSATCVVEVEASLQLFNESGSSTNQWQAAAVVDGRINSAYEQVMGVLPASAASPDTRVFAYSVQLNAGNHSVFTEVKATAAAQVDHVHIDYRFYSNPE
jgi:hypothetical protein